MATSPNTSSSLIQHIEAFIDVSRPPKHQSGSIDAIAALVVKNDRFTIEALVRDLELYLTTTDNIIRARGILLLAEILRRLISKPLGTSTISSLAEFFTSRLADWHSQRGALVGCLALLGRKSDVGMVIYNEARALAESYLMHVQAQSLAVHDRKLCFEVLQCLMDVYPEAVVTLGDEFIYGICDAIDGEMDPRCLMLTFHLVETLMRTFPSSLVESFAGDLFENLGQYFPVCFTHPRSDDFEIKRDDLSRALMNAYCSTPLFEPFVIPLLLDKLSSSVPVAKLDSLKYLNNCILHYGAEKMVKHGKTIWFALKDVIFNFSQGTIFFTTSSLSGDVMSQEDQIVKEALICLQTAISLLNFPADPPFISLMLDDQDIGITLETSKGSQHHLRALGSVLSIASKVSSDCCSRVFQNFLPSLVDLLGVPLSSSSTVCFTECEMSYKILNFGALYLCIELLASCQELSMGAQDLSPSVQDCWWSMLKDFSCPLTGVLRSALKNHCSTGNTVPEQISCVVKGLQIFATFPAHCSPVSEDVYEDILTSFTFIITGSSDDTFLWKLSLKALAQIGLYIENFQDSKKIISFKKIVVERLVLLLSLDDSTMPLAHKLEALCQIGVTGLDYMSMVIQGLEEEIFSNFSKINGNLRSAESLVLLLECYCSRVLPWCHKSGKFEQVAMHFAVKIWNVVENCSYFGTGLHKQALLNSSMMAMKYVVGDCTEESQGLIVQKAYHILLSMTSLPMKSLLFPSSKLESLQFIPDVSGLSCKDMTPRLLSQIFEVSLSCKDEWLVSLFASAVIALHPHTPLPDLRSLIKLFTVFLIKGHIPAAEALASIINKWPADGKVSSVYKLEEVINVILEVLYGVLYFAPLETCNNINNTGDSLGSFCPSSFQIHVVNALAWLGKGMLMRGHERVKEITVVLMKCVLSRQIIPVNPEHPYDSENGNRQDTRTLVALSAADAFHVFLSDSEVCLNKRFHSMIRPLYKQRFFTSMMPVLLSSIKESNSSSTRYVLYRAFGHVISGTPLAAVVADAKKVVLPLLDGLSVLGTELRNKEMTYSLLLVLSGILMDENGKEAVMENVHIIISRLIWLISYPHMMLVRETAIQCLVAMSALPHSRIYPLRPQVLRALSKSLDDKKRAVRQEAIRCRQAWASIASRSLHF